MPMAGQRLLRTHINRFRYSLEKALKQSDLRAKPEGLDASQALPIDLSFATPCGNGFLAQVGRRSFATPGAAVPRHAHEVRGVARWVG